MHPKFCMYDHFHIINNPCKYKCDTSQSFYTYIYKNYGECKMQFMNNGFNTFKVNDSTHVQMLTIQVIYEKNY